MATFGKQQVRGGFKIKKAVTLPVFKLTPGEEVYLRFLGAMHVGKKTSAAVGGKEMEPATIAEVGDLQTGEIGLLICATVLQQELRTNYPDDSYVGKSFAITMTKVPEKKYNLYSIAEIDEDEAQVEAAPEAPVTQIKSAKKR
jgi:hypothetical protein